MTNKTTKTTLPVLLTAVILLWAGFLASRASQDGERAVELWRKSLISGATTPMRARMTITERIHGRTTTTVAQVIQGTGGRYRVAFTQPRDAAGRIVTSDGRVFWTYEPTKKLLTKNAQVSGTGQGALRTDPLIEDNYRIRLISDSAVVAGRPAYQIELTPRQVGKSRQQRWIDKATFKTLRIETRFADGVTARVIDYSEVTLPALVKQIDFQPLRMPGLRVEDGSTPASYIPASQVRDRARALGLTSDAPLGFRLLQITSVEVGDKPNLQLLYSDGIETVSIFAQDGGRTPKIIPVNWQRESVNGVLVFQEKSGHTNTFVWSANGHRFTAVSHLQIDALNLFLSGIIR